MEVILLERIARLGQMGDVVRVKDGFARNFLLPRGKALRATEENRTRFEKMKTELEARSLTLKTEADQVAGKLDGKSFTVLRQASEGGQLFGSVSPRDLIALLGDGGFRVNRNQVALNAPIKTIGQHKVPIALHPDADRARRGRHAVARTDRAGGGRNRRGSIFRTGRRRGGATARKRRAARNTRAGRRGLSGSELGPGLGSPPISREYCRAAPARRHWIGIQRLRLSSA
jgi:large subunit ribosomal protein L9